MTRAILVCWHKYTPFGSEFYNPMFEFFIKMLSTYIDEFDKVYFLDSTWNFTDKDKEKIKSVKGEVVKVDPSLRYYDAYKAVLPQIKEDLILLMDNDFIIYKPTVIESTFQLLIENPALSRSTDYDVVSITDTIGTMKVPLKTGNKLCPYFFATRKELLMKYLDVDWSPDAMPYTETFGLLTEALLKDGLRVYEMEDDKSNIVMDEYGGIIEIPSPGKNLGYMHIRSGSVPAYLLATKYYGSKDTYWEYIKNQPKTEIFRHCAWYQYMGGDPKEIVEDCGAIMGNWDIYFDKFKEYHGL